VPAQSAGDDEGPAAPSAVMGTAGPAIAAKVTAAGGSIPSAVTKDEFAELTIEVAELRAEVLRLRETVGQLQSKLQSLMS
jgi:hypothetical protein